MLTSLNFPQLDFVKPSSGFHPVTWERVNKRLKLIQLDLIQTHHARSQALIKASMYSMYILSAHLHETTVQKSFYFQEKLGTKKIHTSSSSLPFSVVQHGFTILILDVVILVILNTFLSTLKELHMFKNHMETIE